MSGIQQLLLGGPFGAGAQGDPNWQNVTLLSGTTNTNAGQNNTFLDSSTNNFTVTRNGNTTQGTFSPFSQADGYWSNYFDGSGDYISLPNSSISLGSGNCAVEFWCYITGEPSSNPFLFDNFGNSSARLYAYYDGSTMYLNADGNTRTTTFAYNTWNFFQFTRSSGTGGWYLNGTLIGTTFSTTGTINLQRMTIGAAEESGTANPNQWYQGYISNFRASNTNRSTSVPTTPFSSDANAVVLTCQSNRFIDNSASPLTLTTTGNTAVIPFQPFGAPIVPYSTSTIGGSGYFDGSGDSLSTTSTSQFNFGTGDFTIEFWVYPTATQAAYAGVVVQATDSDPSWYVQYDVNGTKLRLTSYSLNILVSATSVPINTWTHIAIVRNGSGSNNCKMYFNGVQDAQGTWTTTLGQTSALKIGAGSAGVGSPTIQGYLSSLRIVNGTAVYTTGFTPPTSPPTAITNTSLLLNFTNANIYDQAAKNDLETVGNAQVSTSVFKYGTSSAYFDGSGDYLISNSSTDLYAFGTGEFTIEFWLRLVSTPAGGSYFTLYDSRPTSGSGNYPTIYLNGSGATLIYYANNANRITGPDLSTGQWYHIAVCRAGTSTKMYLDGNQVGSTYSDSLNYINASARPSIGANGYDLSTGYLNGYISDLRITKGLARYPYNFIPPTTSLPNFYQAQTLTADPYFEYTTLLLPGSGTNGAQNNTFLDSSTNAFSITRNGNTTQGTFSPFSQTGWSNYFDGTGDNIVSAVDTGLNLSTGDFTIEFWIYATALTAGKAAVQLGNGTNLYSALIAYYSGGGLETYLSSNGTDWDIASGQKMGTLELGQWIHCAITRSGSTFRTFKNGSLISSFTSSANLYLSSNQISVGRAQNTEYWPGYVSNVRVVKGTALYTASFTPSTTPLTAVSGTTFLSCQSNRFVDNSSSALAITVNGDTSVQAFSPFAPTAAYSVATNGGSGYFDGSGDALLVNDSSQFTLGTNNFTVEAWVYPTTTGVQRIISGQSNSGASGSTISYWLDINSSNQPRILIWSGGTDYTATSSVAVSANQWIHLAGVRNGNTLTIYVNGTSTGTVSVTGVTVNDSSNQLGIGQLGEHTNVPWSGYISSFRLVNGTAVYTSNFTPPTAPLTNITNTALLTNFTNAGITDATAKNDLETVGNAQISNGAAKWGSTSMSFDGTGDWLKGPNSPNLYIGSGDFTIEGWLYLNATGLEKGIVSQFNSNGTGPGWTLYVRTTNVLEFYGGSGTVTVTGTTAISATTWTHFAVCRYGSTITIYVNGAANGTATNSSFSDDTTASFYVGGRADTASLSLNGYLQDVRITKGIARYTQNFTPPTAAFQLL